MKIGFGQRPLNDAIVTKARGAAVSAVENGFTREMKFDISDRVQGIWRPRAGEIRAFKSDILLTAFYGESAGGPFLLLGADLCELSFEQVDRFKAPLVDRFGLHPDRILCLPTHCHINVEFDTAKQRDIILAAAEDAVRSSTEAEMAALHLDIDADHFVINRRVHVPGVGTRTVMFNDNCEILADRMVVTEQLRTWIKNLGGKPEGYLAPGVEIVTQGPVDPRLQTLCFRDIRSKAMLGTLTRFACHPVIVSEKKSNGDISADYPGHLRARLREKLGGISFFGQGQCGDLRPLIREYSHDFARSFGYALADRVIAAAEKGLAWTPLTRAVYLTEPLVLPLRRDLPRTEEEAAVERERIDKAFDSEPDLEKRRKLQNRYWFYYRAHEVKRVLRPEWLRAGHITHALHALKLNDQILLANPAEIFLSTRNAMIRGFEALYPVTFSICNEEMSYVPSKEDFDRGGYEPSVCLAEPGSTDIYTDAAQRLLGRISKM